MSRRRKILTRTAANVPEDRSSLRNDIICQIVSFIPTKQAVTTTVLSKLSVMHTLEKKNKKIVLSQNSLHNAFHYTLELALHYSGLGV
jgi:hypothetical protein